MDPSIPELKALFLAALERPSGPERAAFLDESCRGDAFLRAQVEALLNAHAEAGAFLASGPGETEDAGAATIAETLGLTPGPDAETVAIGPSPSSTSADATLGQATETTDGSGPVAPRPLTEGPGDRIGPYTLLQQIGAGGMGVVFMAEQTSPVRRKVALKVIKAGMDTEQVVARFEAERQALALMDHPNIARVLDAGATATGRPFFVIELVNGVPITEYADEAASLRERFDLNLPPDDHPPELPDDPFARPGPGPDEPDEPADTPDDTTADAP